MKQAIIFIFVTISTALHAQQKYWIFFKDKDPNQTNILSETTILNRKKLGYPVFQYSDLSINNTYIETLQKNEILTLQKSKWLNAVSAFLSDSQLLTVKSLNFVSYVEPINNFLIPTYRSNKKEDVKVDFVMQQIGIDAFLAEGITAKNVKIGVIDAGFYEAPSNPFLSNLFTNNQIIATKDLVNKEKKDFFGVSETSSDFHGTEVLGAIAGKNYKENTQIGLATNAQYYLARTDNGNREFRGEEDNWIAAMEWMDSLGVRLINTSLGYAKGFSNPNENYRPDQMDGKTSVISRAAQIAINEKGIILVVSAGNEGDDRDWKIISTPADVEGTIAVGATNEKGLKMGYSSTGAEFSKYIKPNISCFSLFGTSLAAPVITGFVACLLEENPNISPQSAKEILEKSSHLYPYANNYVGYGIPSASKALQLLKGFEIDNMHELRVVKKSEKQIEINVSPKSTIQIFHKKSNKDVISQDEISTKYNFIVLKRNQNETFTTVVSEEKVFEIEWQ